MDIIKKNLVFSIVCFVCILLFLAGSVLAFLEFGQVAAARETIEKSERRIRNLETATPAPSKDNVRASERNIAALETRLDEIREDLERGAIIETSEDGIGVMAAINQFVANYQNRAASHVSDGGEAAPIDLPSDFAFGFEQYRDKSPMLDDQGAVRVLDKQRQVISYLMDRLFESDPQSIVKVEREVLEIAAPKPEGERRRRRRGQEAVESAFKIDPATSARVEGAIDTLAFSITYEGYTASLRKFLNSLSNFDLPIVVRSIEVKRVAGESSVDSRAAATSTEQFTTDFDSLDDEAPEVEFEAQEPVISEVLSTFTIVLEFIEIVLDEDAPESEEEYTDE